VINRAIVIVLDACGIGEAPDTAAFGDTGSNTIVHTAEAVGGLNCPNLERMGLGHLDEIMGIAPAQAPIASYATMREQSAGKDSTSGHWELTGLVLDQPFPVYPNGFSREIIGRFTAETGRGVLGNLPASGTEIIKELGDRHCETGELIVYTSADSVFQIAAHEGVVPINELYRYCRIAREILQGDDAVGRVIARPFVGTSGNYLRTSGRRDFSLSPPRPTLLNHLMDRGIETVGIGKIDDLFAGNGLSVKIHTESNIDGMNRTIAACADYKTGLILTNLIETDMLWGHRNDPRGFANALEQFDKDLGRLLAAMAPHDVLFVSADHGCDPTTPSTDHSRELVPLLAYGPAIRAGVNLGRRECFADLAATIADVFGVTHPEAGTSFWMSIKN
jgi:phosphopentomutase